MLLIGVRNAAIACKPVGQAGSVAWDGKEERRMTVSLRESMAVIADPRNLDASVEEVFEMMVGLKCRRTTASEPPAYHTASVTAVVGFGGLLSGACIFRLGSETAIKVAAHMTGIEFAEVDDTVKDAVGEVCNMLAGSWKGKVPELAANCGLSVPAVITGSDYNLHVQAPEFQLHHAYAFEGHTFAVTIVCDGMQ
jgi:chemotaxis protein CheX